MLRFFRKNVVVFFCQQIDKSVNVAQRRAQVVRHRIAEGLELLVGGGELRGALLYAPLERGVQPADLLLGPAPVGQPNIL